uniref:Interleukin-3 n=1 Tax=Myotis myotis TaxID=51298 RepID=A0A7J7XGP1_MYOMY|nr:interleukin 3 [Myotis myotis]
MSSLPALPLFLLLLALHAPRAQGRPLTTCLKLVKEIEAILNKTPVPSQEPLSINEAFILTNNSFLKRNLDIFLNATNNFTDGDKIRTNLEVFKTVLPTSTSKEKPFSIKNWGDFRRKLSEYLGTLKKWVC